MSDYPAFVRLIRLVGREAVMNALSLPTDPDPSGLTEQQRSRLQELVDAEIESVAVQLVQEAAASDDVSSREDALAFVREQVQGFGDLLTADQAAHLERLAADATADWG